MENALFKSAGFGGFNRKDVIEFIEARAREHADALERSKQETREARNSAEALSAKLEETERQLEALRQEMRAVSQKLEEQSARVEEELARATKLAGELEAEKAARETLLASEKSVTQARLEAEKSAYLEAVKADYEEQIRNLETENRALLGQLESLKETAASERDAAVSSIEAEMRALIQKLEAEKNALAQQLETERESEADKANSVALCSTEELETAKQALAVCQSEKEALEQRIRSMEPVISSYEIIKNRLAEIEFSAYCRAERIEEAAVSNAAEVRRKAEQMLIGLRSDYNTILENLNASCTYVVDRLSRVQESLTGLDSAFVQAGDSITDMCARLSKEKTQAPNPLPLEETHASYTATPSVLEDLPQGNEVPFPEDQL